MVLGISLNWQEMFTVRLTLNVERQIQRYPRSQWKKVSTAYFFNNKFHTLFKQ